MREPIEHSNKTVKESARARLQKLGITEDLLNTEGLDFDLLYQRLRYVDKPYSYRRILITEKWQLRALSGLDVMSEEMNPHQLQDNYGATPIYYAAWSGKLEVVNWLLTHNLEWMRISDDRGLTPVHYAAWSGNPEILDLIKAQPALTLTIKNILFGRSIMPLHYAAWTGKTEVLDWIKTHMPQTLTLMDARGLTPIHYAAWSGNPQVLDWIKMHAP